MDWRALTLDTISQEPPQESVVAVSSSIPWLRLWVISILAEDDDPCPPAQNTWLIRVSSIVDLHFVISQGPLLYAAAFPCRRLFPAASSLSPLPRRHPTSLTLVYWCTWCTAQDDGAQ
jgi:hypothetical protein